MEMTSPKVANDWAAEVDSLRCVACDGQVVPTNQGEGQGGESSLSCARCGRSYPIRDGVLVVNENPTDDNRIAADFYNSPLWPRFRFWEWSFFLVHGGE